MILDLWTEPFPRFQLEIDPRKTVFKEFAKLGLAIPSGPFHPVTTLVLSLSVTEIVWDNIQKIF